MRLTHRLTLAALALSSLLPAAARPLGAQSDSVKASREPLFTGRDALVAAGFVAGMAAAFPFDKPFARRLRDSSTQAIKIAKKSADALNFLGTPGTLLIGGAMYSSGRWIFHNDEMADLGLHGTEAVAIGLAATLSLKNVVGRARPRVHAGKNYDDPYDFNLFRGFRKNGDDYRSFPSGHTTMSFAAAAAVTSESRRWWPNATWIVAPVMYGGATLVGVARMYTDNHWASDVIGGAAIGTFAGLKVVRYHHTHPGNRIDRWLLSVHLRPDGAGGMAWTVDATPMLNAVDDRLDGRPDGRGR